MRNHAADAEQQFLEFASAQAGQLFRIAYLMCGDWHEAQDLVQIALAKLFVAWGRASRADNVPSYARAVLVNSYLSSRRLRRSRETPVAEIAEPAAPDDDADLRMTLVAALLQLPPRSRAVVVLRHVEDHSIESVDRYLGVTPAAVKSLNARGIAQLREYLGSAVSQELVTAMNVHGADMSKDDIAGMFERVARQIEPDLTAIIGKAAQRGRRLRARRRLAIAMTAIVSAAAISVAASLGTRLAFRHVPGSVPAGPGDVGSQSPRIRPASQRPQQAHGPGMTHRQLIGVLRSMLPAGAVFTHIKGGFPNDAPGGLEVNYNDGKGAVDISLTVAPTDKFGPPPSPGPVPSNLPARAKREMRRQERAALQQYWEIRRNLCPSPLWRDEGQRPAGALPISCVRRVLADGSVERDAVSYADGAGFYGYLIEDRRPDGITVWLQVGNGTLAGSPHYTKAGWPYVDRARPPGSMALWTSIVESPQWHL